MSTRTNYSPCYAGPEHNLATLRAAVYETDSGWTYRVLDIFNDHRFGDLYRSFDTARLAVEAAGFEPRYIVRQPWRLQ